MGTRNVHTNRKSLERCQFSGNYRNSNYIKSGTRGYLLVDGTYSLYNRVKQVWYKKMRTRRTQDHFKVWQWKEKGGVIYLKVEFQSFVLKRDLGSKASGNGLGTFEKVHDFIWFHLPKACLLPCLTA